jgi:RNA polymerase sigma-70 factor (ECF subfamily)
MEAARGPALRRRRGKGFPFVVQPEPEKGDNLVPTLDILNAARGGDRRALEALFARYLPRVRQIVCLRMGRRLASFTEHDDIAQETLLRIFRSLDDFQPRSEGSFRHWIACSVERAIADAARRLGASKRGGGAVGRFGDFSSAVSFTSVLAGSEPTPSKVAASREAEEEVEAALLRLPTHHREIINLRFFCGLSFEEIARELKIGTEATARKALHRALQKLRELLEA